VVRANSSSLRAVGYMASIRSYVSSGFWEWRRRLAVMTESMRSSGSGGD
jgi:hypothetical protein